MLQAVRRENELISSHGSEVQYIEQQVGSAQPSRFDVSGTVRSRARVSD